MNPISKKVDDMKGKMPVSEGSATPLRSDTENMRAVTWQGKRKMSVEYVPKPLITHDEDVVVKITACTICSGSDGHIFAGEIPTMDKGFTVGHEGMGIVVAKGNKVTKLDIGNRCVISFSIACGKCEHCLKKQFTGCETTNDSKLADDFYGHAPAALFGYSRLLGNVAGSQAEFVRVPFGDVNCYKVPDDVPDEKALFLSDVLCTSLHAAELGEVSEGDTVCIWGLGPIGLCTARWCQIKGAKRIIGIDMVPERISLAREKLGIEVFDRTGLTSQQLCDKLLEMEPKGFDCCVEAVGFRFAMSKTHKVSRALGMETDTPELIDECLTCLKPYGKVSIIGDYAGYANMFPVGKIMFKHATLRSGQCPCQKYFKYVMEKVQDGTFDPTFMVSHNISLEDIPAAYEKLHKKEDGFVKVFVKL
ncbi:hypothetical protein HDU92_005595 [Lobulomyces angularis]|nr:hypothetical protein HDU92_005595 [Lobulomyces angularis]